MGKRLPPHLRRAASVRIRAHLSSLESRKRSFGTFSHCSTLPPRFPYLVAAMWIAMILVAPPAASAVHTASSTQTPDTVSAQLDSDPRLAVSRVVLNLVSYARWPTGGPTVRVCVDSAADDVYAGVNGQPISNGRFIAAQILNTLDTPAVSQCDAVYLLDLADNRRRALVSELIGKPVLIIVERDQACEVGSMFCLDIREDHTSFRINLDSIARSGIRVHPGVLQLGRRTTKAR